MRADDAKASAAIDEAVSFLNSSRAPAAAAATATAAAEEMPNASVPAASGGDRKSKDSNLQKAKAKRGAGVKELIQRKQQKRQREKQRKSAKQSAAEPSTTSDTAASSSGSIDPPFSVNEGS